jgi:hypothetical protein
MSLAGYTRLPTGEFIRDSDGSGPYAFDGASMLLTSTGTGGGGGGGGGAVTIASGAVASGAYASGAIASGAYAAGSIAAGAVVQLPSTIGVKLTATSLSTTIATDDAVLGALTETAPATDTASSGLNGRLQRIAQRLTSLVTALGTPFQAGGALGAGSALIGKVGIDQTTPGTTNLVSIGTGGTVTVNALPAGAALIGKVGIDQTTPGTTNLVSIGTGGTVTVNALPAGSALIGKVGIDQTTPGTTNLVSTASKGGRVQLTITRPANATPYTALDAVGGTGTGVSGAALTFAALGPASGHVMLTSIDLLHEVTAIPAGMTSFRLYLYSATPPSALADNAAWDLAAGDVTSYIGYVDFGVINDLGSNLFVQADNVLKHVALDASGNLYGYLVTNGGWTPGANSTVFVLTVRALAV